MLTRQKNFENNINTEEIWKSNKKKTDTFNHEHLSTFSGCNFHLNLLIVMIKNQIKKNF